MQFSTKQKKDFFHKLADMSTLQAGYAMGFDKHYKNDRAIMNAAYKIYNGVKNNPTKFGVDVERANEIAKIVSGRNGNPNAMTVAEKNAIKTDLKSVLQDTRDKMAKIINYKINDIAKSNKKMKALTIADLQKLTTPFATTFDKAQILNGEATEHIALQAKISDDITPEELLALATKQRDDLEVANQGK